MVSRAVFLQTLGHRYLNYAVTTAATCSATGEEEAPCARDDSHAKDTREIAIDGNAHDWQTTSGTAPTCTEPGSGSQVCSYNEEHTQNGVIPINPDAHDWSTAKEVISTVSETTNSMKAITCKHAKSHTKEEEFTGEYATGTAGLDFDLISIDGGTDNSYRVSNKDPDNGTAEGDIFIPAYHRPDAASPYLPVTEIGNGTNSHDSNAFGGISWTSPNTAVTSITVLADEEGTYKLTIISDRAFYYCTNLTSVTIGNGVISIGQAAFSATGLTSVTIPDSVTSIGHLYVFGECVSLTSVTIGSGLTSIPAETFENCIALTSITVGSANTRYASHDGILYNKAQTTVVVVPAGISGSVTIPDGVTSIGYRAFVAGRLTSVTIPASVTSIGYYAFSQCFSLTSIAIPDGVTSIGDGAFYGCSSLTSITVNANNPNYASEGGILYNKVKTQIVVVPTGISGAVTIPASITSIGEYAFSGCSNLTSITIPASVTTIGEWAFSGCMFLASITIPDSVTTIGERAFSGCIYLASITIPNSVTSIGTYVFYQCGLFSITIPASVTSIGYNAFHECMSLTNVTFAGTIASGSFSSGNPFPGDLRDKFYATNTTNGTAGTYTTTAPTSNSSVWTWYAKVAATEKS